MNAAGYVIAAVMAAGCVTQVIMPLPYAFASPWTAALLGALNVLFLLLGFPEPGWRLEAGLCALFCALDLINRRRDRMRKLAGAIGEKSRMIRAAMVRAMRERARPRPVLKPGLQGAR